MKQQRQLSPIEREMVDLILEYLDSHEDSDREDGAAAYILCRGDENAAKLISFLKENPDVDSYDLFIKAAEIAGVNISRESSDEED